MLSSEVVLIDRPKGSSGLLHVDLVPVCDMPEVLLGEAEKPQGVSHIQLMQVFEVLIKPFILAEAKQSNIFIVIMVQLQSEILVY